MSIKVYTAYRLKEGYDLWETLHRIRKKAEKAIDGVLRELASDFEEEAKKDIEFRKKILESVGEKDLEKMPSMDLIFFYMGKQYNLQQTSSQRNPFDFNVGVGVKYHKGRYLFIPYCDCLMSRVLDFMKRDKALEDYAYWNNTDKPGRISYKKWEARGVVWEELCEPDSWKTSLVLDILTPQNYYLFNFWLNDQLKKSERKKKIAKVMREGE